MLPSPPLPRPTHEPWAQQDPSCKLPSLAPAHWEQRACLPAKLHPTCPRRAEGQQLPGALTKSSLQDSPGPSVVKTGARWSQFS